LNSELKNTYLCGANVTIADIAIVAALDDLFRIAVPEDLRK